MNIEQKLEVVQKALEMGAMVKINFYDTRLQEKAEKAANEFAGLIGAEVKKSSSFSINGNYHWLSVNNLDGNIKITFWYDTDKEEVSA